MNNPTKTKLSTPNQIRVLRVIKTRLNRMDFGMARPQDSAWTELCEHCNVNPSQSWFELTASQVDLMIRTGNEMLSFVHKIYS